MKRKVMRLTKSNIVRNITILMTGTVGAQVISMLLSPVITRLYGPEAYGIMGTFNAITNFVIPVSALTYPIAIVIAKEKKEAIGIIKLSLIVTFLISSLSLLFLVIFNDYIIKKFNLEIINWYLYLIPIVILSSGLMQISNQWLIRTKQFSISARVTVLESIISNGSKVVIGAITPVAGVLVVLSAVKNMIRAVLMISFSDLKKRYKELGKSYQIKKIANKYSDFPLFRAPESLISSISEGIPVMLLTIFFGPTATGFYSIGRTVLAMPSELMGKAIGDVFYPHIAESANNNKNVTTILIKATLALVLVGVIPFGLIMLFGPPVFAFIFGEEWRVAGEYASWVAIWIYTSFINRPCVRTLPVLNAQRFHLIYTTLMLVVRILLMSIGYYLYSNDVIVIALFSISGALLNIGLIIITILMSRKASYTFER